MSLCQNEKERHSTCGTPVKSVSVSRKRTASERSTCGTPVNSPVTSTNLSVVSRNSMGTERSIYGTPVYEHALLPFFTPPGATEKKRLRCYVHGRLVEKAKPKKVGYICSTCKVGLCVECHYVLHNVPAYRGFVAQLIDENHHKPYPFIRYDATVFNYNATFVEVDRTRGCTPPPGRR